MRTVKLDHETPRESGVKIPKICVPATHLRHAYSKANNRLRQTLKTLEGFSHKTATAKRGIIEEHVFSHCQPWQLAQEDFPSTLFAG